MPRPVLAHDYICIDEQIGVTENAGPENGGPRVIRGQQMQRRKTKDQISGTKNAGPKNEGGENEGPWV